MTPARCKLLGMDVEAGLDWKESEIDSCFQDIAVVSGSGIGRRESRTKI